MSTQTVEIKDPDIIEIPADMQLGFDADGMPKTDPVEKVAPEAKATLAELETMRRERDEVAGRLAIEAEAKAKAEAEAKEAREASELLTGRLGKTEAVLHDRTIQGVAAHYRSVHSEHQQIVNAIASTEALATSHEAELAAANEAGDHIKAARVQRLLSRAEAHLAQLEAGKSAAAQEVQRAERSWQDVNAAPPEPKREEPKPKAEVVETKKPAATTKPDPEAWINQFPKKTTGEWLKAHKTYVTDEAKHKELLDFANEWYNEGNPLHTKDFIAALNEKFDPEAVTTMTEEAPKTEAKVAKAKATPAAPVSRGGSTFSSTNMDAKQVRLPPKLAAFVKASGLDPTQYALGAVEDIKAGRLPKNFLDPDYPHNF